MCSFNYAVHPQYEDGGHCVDSEADTESDIVQDQCRSGGSDR